MFLTVIGLLPLPLPGQVVTLEVGPNSKRFSRAQENGSTLLNEHLSCDVKVWGSCSCETLSS